MSKFDFEDDFVYSDEMSDEELRAETMAIAELLHWENDNNEDDSEYEVNHPQMQKLCDVLEWFTNQIMPHYGDYISPVQLQPRKQYAAVYVHTGILGMSLDEIFKFSKICTYCTSINISSEANDMVQFELIIPNVFIKKH